MEPPPMILPKGIVFNTDRVYKEVASYTIVPPEKIYEYWHVYTTTFGKLKDPTANRLENFWWHVMGSDRRSLPGPTLARLFEQISNGPTFVPLRGPSNRYEGPSFQNMPVDLAAVMQLFKMSSGSSLSNKEPAKKVDMLKAMLSSSSKPPPSHPILKKPRGPSTSGPRPTARFVSPAGSHDETDNRESEASSSTSTAGANTSRLKSSGSSTSKQKTKKLVSVGHRKKAAGFVASSASKRRPVAPRRQSSQSSATGSEVGSREERSSLSSRYPVPQRPVSTIPEQPGGAVTTVPRDDGGQLSAKAAGKRPAFITTGSSDSGRSQLAAVPQQSIVKQLDVPSSRPLEPKVQISGKDVVYKSSRNRPRQTEEERRTPVHDQSSAQEHTRPEHEPVTLSRGIVDENASKTVPRDVQHNRRVPPQGLLSTSTATTSNIAAQGTITEFAENASAWAAATARQEEALETGLRRSGSAATLNPAPPSSSPSLPLGRSKSQLTLLLKRQEEKRTRR